MHIMGWFAINAGHDWLSYSVISWTQVAPINTGSRIKPIEYNIRFPINDHQEYHGP